MTRLAMGVMIALAGCATSESEPHFRWSAFDPETRATLSGSGTPLWVIARSPLGEVPTLYEAIAEMRFENYPKPSSKIPLEHPALVINVSGPEADQYPRARTLHIGANGLDTLNSYISANAITYVADSGVVDYRSTDGGGSATFTLWYTLYRDAETYPTTLRVTGTYRFED